MTHSLLEIEEGRKILGGGKQKRSKHGSMASVNQLF